MEDRGTCPKTWRNNQMDKKKVVKILGAVAIAGAAFVSTTSVNTVSATEVNKQVQKALDAGNVLKWAISTEGSANGSTRPYPQFNAAKSARDAAVAAINKLPAAQKNIQMAKIEKDVNTHIARAMNYIDAITAGEKMEAKQVALQVQLEKGIIDDATEKAYHELSNEIRKQAVILDRVYGKSTRDAIRDQYKETAQVYAIAQNMP